MNEQQRIQLNRDYAAITGKEPKHFVCPITLRDEPASELCDGHILNESIQSASRSTVIERKDVDNYFGHTIEPDLVKLLNMRVWTTEDLLRHGKGLIIEGPNGERMEAFIAGAAARKKFQQIDLYDAKKTVIRSPFLRSHKLEPKLYEKMEIECTVTLQNSAVTGAFLKAGYLALFRMLGYVWVLSPDGDKVRRTLNAFYEDHAGKANALELFGEFQGCTSVVLNDAMANRPDTLEGGSLLLHFAEGDRVRGLAFAITCLFRVNGMVGTVTMPCHNREGHYFAAFEYYKKFLADRSMPHNVYFCRFNGQHFEIATEPLRLFFTTSRPPEANAKPVSPLDVQSED